MNASKIKNAFTRKIGPLPAWAWLGIFGVAVWYFRNKISSQGGTTTASTQTGEVQADTSDQTPVDIPAGDSVYDPNSGQLVTAPGGGGTGDGTSGTTTPTTTGDGGVAAAITALTKALTQGTGSAVTLSGRKGGNTKGGGRPRLRGKGAKRAPSGAKRPKAPKGMRAVGLGKGHWEFLPKSSKKKNPKGKDGSKQGPKVTGFKSEGKTSRSNTTTKTPKGRSRVAHSTMVGRPRGAAAKPASTARNRPKAPVVAKSTANQRPAAVHTPAASKAAPKATSRRAPAPKAVPRKPAPRKPTPRPAPKRRH